MSVHLEQLHQLQPAVSINSCLYLKNILVRCSERCTRRRTAWQHYHSSYYFSLQMTICRCATAMNMGFSRTMHTHKHKYTLNAHECATSTHLACLRNESQPLLQSSRLLFQFLCTIQTHFPFLRFWWPL